MRRIGLYVVILIMLAGCGVLDELAVDSPAEEGCNATATLGDEASSGRLVVSLNNCIATVIPVDWQMMDISYQGFNGTAQGFLVDQNAYRLILYPPGATESDVTKEIQLMLPTTSFVAAKPVGDLNAAELAGMIMPANMFSTQEDVPLVSPIIAPVYGAALTMAYNTQNLEDAATAVESLDLDVPAAAFYYLDTEGVRIGVEVVFELDEGVYGLIHAVDMAGELDSLMPIVMDIVNRTVWQPE